MKFVKFKDSRYNPHGPHLDRDIVEHLEYLENLASQCESVTELGLNNAHSTAAFLAGCKGKVVSYDIVRPSSVDLIRSIEDLPCDWYFIQHDTGDPELVIDETDFLFIDSWHCYDHLKKELALHAGKARRFIGFHDTVSHGETSNDGGHGLKGIMPAIREFLTDHPEWVIKDEFTHNNGLMTLERGAAYEDSTINS